MSRVNPNTDRRVQLTFNETCARLGVSADTLRRMVARQQIGFTRVGSGRGWLRFDPDAIDTYLRRRTVPAAA